MSLTSLLWVSLILAEQHGRADTTILSAPSLLDSAVVAPTLRKEKDMIDVLQQAFGKWANPEGGRLDNKGVHLSVVPAAGYTTVTGFAAVLSANLTLPSSGGKVSNILTSIAYTQHKQTILPFQATFWSPDNNYIYIADLRFMNYPSTTFGLGSKSSITAGDTIDFNYLKLHGTVMRKLSHNLYAGIGYYFDRFWDIEETGPPTGGPSGFQRYGFAPTSTSSGPSLRLLLDSRDNPVASRKGWYVNIQARSSLEALGSDTNWHSLMAEARTYFPFPAHSRNVLAFWSYNVITLAGKPPYLMLPSTGWDDFYNTGRGYAQGRYRGRNMTYLESEYRFPLSRNGLFGAVIFANVQTFSKDPTRQLHTLLPGFGTGLRIKINKFSGANLCIDYGWGLDGQQGISVNLGEVF